MVYVWVVNRQNRFAEYKYTRVHMCMYTVHKLKTLKCMSRYHGQHHNCYLLLLWLLLLFFFLHWRKQYRVSKLRNSYSSYRICREMRAWRGKIIITEKNKPVKIYLLYYVYIYIPINEKINSKHVMTLIMENSCRLRNVSPSIIGWRQSEIQSS